MHADMHANIGERGETCIYHMTIPIAFVPTISAPLLVFYDKVAYTHTPRSPQPRVGREVEFGKKKESVAIQNETFLVYRVLVVLECQSSIKNMELTVSMTKKQ